MHFPLISKEIIVIFRKKKYPGTFRNLRLTPPHPHLNTKKLPWVLFEIWVLHHPPPRVLFIICAIEKVLAPPPPPPPPPPIRRHFLHTYILGAVVFCFFCYKVYCKPCQFSI